MTRCLSSLLLVFTGLLLSVAHAQTPATPPAASVPVERPKTAKAASTAKTAPYTGPTVDSGPIPDLAPVTPPPGTLSPIETLTLDLLAVTNQRDDALTKLGQCEAAVAPVEATQRRQQLSTRIRAFVDLVEKTHPGYKLDLQKGALVPDPTAKTPPKTDPPVDPPAPSPPKE